MNPLHHACSAPRLGSHTVETKNKDHAENTARARRAKMTEEGLLEVAGLVNPEALPGHSLLLVGVKLKTTDLVNKGEEFSPQPTCRLLLLKCLWYIFSMTQFYSDPLLAVRRIFLTRLGHYQAKVFLFGSMARGEARQSSDIDIAVLPVEKLPRGLLSAIREELEESRIPYRVELIDLSRASPRFAAHVQEVGIPWKD